MEAVSVKEREGESVLGRKREKEWLSKGERVSRKEMGCWGAFVGALLPIAMKR